MGEQEIIAAHAEMRNIKVRVVDPDHAERVESPEFREAKRRLKEDGHYKCYISGREGPEANLQVHHRASEYMFGNIVDFDLLKAFCEEWDIYGYGKLLKNKPITSVDDVRNCMVLAQEFHTGVDHADEGSAEGIHYLPFPEWIMQKLAIPGANPVPQKGETWQQAMERVKAHEIKTERIDSV